MTLIDRAPVGAVRTDGKVALVGLGRDEIGAELARIGIEPKKIELSSWVYAELHLLSYRHPAACSKFDGPRDCLAGYHCPRRPRRMADDAREPQAHQYRFHGHGRAAL